FFTSSSSTLFPYTTLFRSDGSVIGPIKASFAGKTIIVRDGKVDIEEGDVILRQLPSGRDERNIITDATFYSRGVGGMGAHYQLRSEEHTSELQSRENLVCR